jgi:hypothetical protein
MTMLDERALRRQDFLHGTPIRLADGQWWSFPAPTEAIGAGHPDYDDTVAMIPEAEDEVERVRAELALAICLLERNYDLPPGGLLALLCYAPDNPALAEVQRAFRRVAHEHVIQPRPLADPFAPREVPGRTVSAAA